MSLTVTHAFVPIAAMVAVAQRPIHRRLIAAAVLAAMLPDLDAFMHLLFGATHDSVYSHRGFTHSLGMALLFGALAAVFHPFLKVRPSIAGIVVATAMASHGLLDMMTDSGKPVAYLWPLSSVRFFADWRPFPGSSVQELPFFNEVTGRIGPEIVRVIIPMFVAAIVIRGCLMALKRTERQKRPLSDR